jgi:peroxin-7
VEKVTSLLTLPAHQGQIYRASWCPNVPSTIATTGADGFIHGFDLRTPTPSRPIWSIRAGESDVLDLDWNKYEPTLIASAGKDGGIRVWDIRSGGRGPLVELKGHRLAVRKVA